MRAATVLNRTSALHKLMCLTTNLRLNKNLNKQCHCLVKEAGTTGTGNHVVATATLTVVLLNLWGSINNILYLFVGFTVFVLLYNYVLTNPVLSTVCAEILVWLWFLHMLVCCLSVVSNGPGVVDKPQLDYFVHQEIPCFLYRTKCIWKLIYCPLINLFNLLVLVLLLVQLYPKKHVSKFYAGICRKRRLRWRDVNNSEASD